MSSKIIEIDFDDFLFNEDNYSTSNITNIINIPESDFAFIFNLTSSADPWILKFIPSIVIYSITFIVGLFGNLLVIFSIIYLKRLQSITNLFLLSLATADLLLIIICVPIKITEFFTNYWIFGAFMCKIFHYMQNFSAICSIFNLTVMSLERYLAILHPLRAKYTCTRNRAKIIIFFIWVLAFFAASPVIIGKEAVKTGLVKQVDICIRVWTPLKWRIFEIYRSLIILVLPFSIMLFTYTKICIKLWQMPNSRRRLVETCNYPTEKKESTETSESLFKKFGQSKPSIKTVVSNQSSMIRSDDDSTRKQIIKMLVCIIAIFFISWAPITINNLLVSFEILPNVNFGALWHIRLAFYVMSYFNSCINPIVYAFMSKNFREAFKHIFSKIICIGQPNELIINENLRFKYLNNNNYDICGNNSEKTQETQEPKRSLICGTPKTQMSICL